MIQKICLSIIAFAFQNIGAQEMDSLALQFRFKFGNQSIAVDKKYQSAKNDTLQIEVLKMYISNIELEYTNGSVFKNQKAQLIDIEKPETMRFAVSPKTSRRLANLTFTVGIDSLTSVSGALSGDLDPSKGMYWAWQSGYINMKIEGMSPSCKTRKNKFQFHIGGYLKPYYALRKVTLTVKNPNPEITIDLSKIFSKISLSETNSIMIPGKKAMSIADYGAQMFSIE